MEDTQGKNQKAAPNGWEWSLSRVIMYTKHTDVFLIILDNFLGGGDSEINTAWHSKYGKQKAT